MVEVGMKLFGDRELRRALGGMRAATQRKIVRPAVNAALTPVNKAAKRSAPKRTGQLKRSIGKVVRLYKKRGVIWGGVGPRKGFKVIIDGKAVDPTKYAHLVERGTVRTKANPFLRRALDENKSEAKRIMAERIRAGIAKEVARQKAKARARGT